MSSLKNLAAKWNMIEYYETFFDSLVPVQSKYKSHTITESDIKLCRGLKHHISTNSDYYDCMLEWRFEDNIDTISTPEEMGRVYVALQFATMTGIISDDFIKENNVKDYHIDLLRCLYLDFGDNDINMGFKRPFGNSNVLGDVASSMKKYGYDIYDENDDIDVQKAEEVLVEFVNILSKFVTDFDLKFRSLKPIELSGDVLILRSDSKNNWLKNLPWLERIHSHLYRWQLDKNEVRDITLDKILND